MPTSYLGIYIPKPDGADGQNELGGSMPRHSPTTSPPARHVAEDLAVMCAWGQGGGAMRDEILHHPQCPLHPVAHLGGAGSREEHPMSWRGPQVTRSNPESRRPFAGRCHQPAPRCKESLPPVTKLADNHSCAAYPYDKPAPTQGRLYRPATPSPGPPARPLHCPVVPGEAERTLDQSGGLRL